MKEIESIFAPKPIGPYSQGMLVRKTMYTSGQIGINPVTMKLEEGIENQTNRMCKNILEVIKEAGFTFANVVKTTIYLTDMEDYDIVNGIYGAYFPNKPARSCIQVAGLPAGALVEIEAVIKEI